MTGVLRRWRLAPAALGVWGAAALTIPMPDAALPTVLVTAGAGVVALLLSRRRPALALVAVALLAASAAAGTVAAAAPSRASAAATALGAGRSVAVEAVLTGKADRQEWGTTADARLASVDPGDGPRRLDSPIRVRLAGAEVWPPDAVVGARIAVSGRAVREDAGSRAVVLVQTSDLRVISAPAAPLDIAAGLRTSLQRAVAGLPEPGAGLVAGLAVGDTSQVSEALEADMKTASLSHLTAVSGANCAIVVGAAFGLAALCGARRGVRIAVGLTALAGFVVLVTPEPSVVRAAVMAGVAMLALVLGRLSAGSALLCVAVVVCLIVDPWLALSLGFALSVGATLALLVLARPLSAGLGRFLPGPLALALAVPLSAEILCAPLLVLIEPTVPLWGIPANLLAGVAAPVATVTGLVACLAAPVPFVQLGLAAVGWVPAAWIGGVATTIAGLPAPRLPWIGGPLGAGVLALVGAGVAVVVAGTAPKWIRRVAALLLAVVLGIGAGAAVLAGVAAPLTVPADRAVTACDVGQGDAVVIESAGRVALVDTGPEPAPLSSCLAALGVDRIDLLVLTHFDVDHVGGVAAVVGRVETVIHGPVPDAAARRILAGLSEAGAEVARADRGTNGVLGSAWWRVLWPLSDAAAAGNDASIVLDVRGPDVPATLLLGDLGAESQAALRRSGDLVPPYPIVKVAHHGSADQDHELYRVARPSVAVVPVGAENRYGHPRREILDVLAATGAATARTDTDGIVAIRPDDVGLRIWRQRSMPGVGAAD